MESKELPTAARPRYISQRLNVCYPDVRLAVISRNSAVIERLAREQRGFGAHYLDLCAAGLHDEHDALTWMARIVQRQVDCPLVLDSADADVIITAFDCCERPPIVNALSAGLLRCGNGQRVISLPASAFVISTFDPQTSNSTTDRIASLREVMRHIAPGSPSTLIADPLFYPHRHADHRWQESCSVAHDIGAIWPELGLLCAVGNVTFRRGKGDRTHAEVAANAVAEGFDWILCDMAKVGRGTRRTSVETGQAGAIVL